ncbi:hypothetical protein [Paenibacillus selenitireducens]|uniref:hypothetical protein n=1 Tax=Paenibacillus selenitireducens TaxID=1324314 RepID=UPI00130209CF|nr:hypothetical protein [Paenibacillus selenitireducens]
MKKLANRITNSFTKLASTIGDPKSDDKPIIFFHDPSKQKKAQNTLKQKQK